MASISIIGCGNHVTKNILPALNRARIHLKKIFVRTTPAQGEVATTGVVFDHLSNIGHGKGEWIYIATHPFSHYELSKRMLLLGYNVICEKPITLNTRDYLDLLQIAEQKKLRILEMCMYQFHSSFKTFRKIVEQELKHKTKITISFCIPELPHSDFRYSSKLGGGALNDLGYYPLSAAASFLENSCIEKCVATYDPKRQIDLHGKAMLSERKATVELVWALNSQYKNEARFQSMHQEILINRIFSKPHDLESSLISQSNGTNKVIKLQADDHFSNFFIAALEGRTQRSHEETLRCLSLMEQFRCKAINVPTDEQTS